MKDYILSAESIIDLSPEYAEQLGLSIIYSNYEINGEIYLDDFGQSLDMDDFYQKMREGASPTTSRINTATYLEYFRQLADTGKDILHICLSTGLSSQYSSLLEAFEILEKEYPDQKFFPVDSLMGCSGVGMLAAKLSSLRDQGMDIENVYKWAEDNKIHVINYTFNENLEYVARGGRISKAAASIGGLLHICPLIMVDNDGHLQVVDKIRTRKKMLKSLINRMEENAIGGLDYDDQIFLANGDNMEVVEEMKEMIKEKFPKAVGNIKVFNVGPTIGSHIGPGSLRCILLGQGSHGCKQKISIKK